MTGTMALWYRLCRPHLPTEGCRGRTNGAMAPSIQGRGISREWNYKYWNAV